MTNKTVGQLTDSDLGKKFTIEPHYQDPNRPEGEEFPGWPGGMLINYKHFYQGLEWGQGVSLTTVVYSGEIEPITMRQDTEIIVVD